MGKPDNICRLFLRLLNCSKGGEGINFNDLIKQIKSNNNNLIKSLKEFEQSGAINSKGEISTKQVIRSIADYSIEFFFTDNTAEVNFLLIALSSLSGKKEKALIINADGKLYLRNN